MEFLSGLFHSRDKPTNSTNGSAYLFLFGGSNSGKAVNKRSAMQMTAVYACVRILSESIAGLPVHIYKYTISGLTICNSLLFTSGIILLWYLSVLQPAELH